MLKRYSPLAVFFLILSCILLSCSRPKKALQEGNEFYYYTLERRIESIDTIEKAMRAKYALLGIKEKRLGIDPDNLFSQARSREARYPNKRSTFFQAVSNLWFFDRVKQITARFQDTHLQINPLVTLPKIYLGLDIMEVEDGFVVSSIHSFLDEYLADQGIDLRVGDKVYEIDGKPIGNLRKKLASYISASSRSYRDQLATDGLTSRDYKYPKNGKTNLTIRNHLGKIISIPLQRYYDFEMQRMDAIYYLQRRGFVYRSAEGSSVLGYTLFDQPSQVESSETYFGIEDPTSVILRTGFLRIRGKKYGFIQLYSFLEEFVQMAGDFSSHTRWDQPIVELILKLKEKNIPLIIDLRVNQGGHVEYPVRLLSLIARSGEAYPSYMEGFRITPNIQQIWQRVAPELGYFERDAKTAKIIRRAINQGQSHSGMWMKTEDIEPASDVEGFDQSVTVFTSSRCVSACDIFALLLESSKRARIIGSPTNGTGSGFFEWAPYSSTTWVDMYEIFSLEIPNMLFGHGLHQGPGEFLTESATIRFNRENRPVNPDQFYKTTIRDILHGDEGWFEQVNDGTLTH